MQKPKVQITEIKWRLDGTHDSFLCGVADREHDRVVLWYELGRDWTVADGQLILPKGTLSLGYFWTDRNYNIYHFIQPAPSPQSPVSNTTIGLYINVSDRPKLRAERLEWTDWVVDILIAPDLGTLILDEEELNDLEETHHPLIPKIHQIKNEILKNQQKITQEIESTTHQLLTPNS